MPVRPGELLPSVLHTSADLGPGFSISQSTASGKALATFKQLWVAVFGIHMYMLSESLGLTRGICVWAATAAAAGGAEPARRAAGPLKVAPGELLGTLNLPRYVDIVALQLWKVASGKQEATTGQQVHHSG
jgi:hypothetical protein